MNESNEPPNMIDQNKLEKLDEKWLGLFYSRVTDQYTLARNSLHNTHQWAITLIFGLVTAIFTLSSSQNPYPNEMGFIALLLSFPLLFRFFVRSCLEYSIHEKWRKIRDVIDKYYYYPKIDSQHERDVQIYLREVIKIYYFDWRSPCSLGSIIKSNLKLAYLWPLIIYIFLIGWGFIQLPYTPTIKLVSIITIMFMIYELVAFLTYKGFDYQRPFAPNPW